MRLFTTVLWAMALVEPARADNTVFSPPVLGAAFDAGSHTLRLVMGVPGAAGQGRALNAGLSLTSACVDSASRAGLGWTKDGGVVALSWQVEAASFRQLDGAFSDSARCAAAGGSAVLAGAGGVQIWSGLPGAAQLSAAYPAEVLGGVPESVALSGDGSTAAVVLRSGVVIELGEGVHATGLAGRAIAYGGRDLFVLTESGQVVAVNESGQAVVAGTDDLKPVLSADENWVVLIGQDSGHVAIYGHSGEKVAELETDCRASSIHPLGIPGSFAIADRNGGAWILAVAGEPTIQRLSILPEETR